MVGSNESYHNEPKITEEQREIIKSALIARQEEKLRETLGEIEQLKGSTREALNTVIESWKQKVASSEGSIQDVLDDERAGDS